MTSLIRRQTEPEAYPFDGLNITVHDYQKPTTVPRASQTSVLNHAYQLVKIAVSGNVGWKSGKITFPLIGTSCSNAYTFAQLPPSVLFQDEDTRAVKEWGGPITEDEIFAMHDLEDFSGTDLTHLLEAKDAISLTDSEAPSKRENDPNLSIEPELKRRKLNTGSIYRVIPQPHIHPSPFFPSELVLRGRPFNNTKPVFISPYTTLSLPDDARVAWLIPVRGILPWEGCTSGAFSDGSHDLPFPPESDVNDQISWTPASLLKFWDFILELREAASLGPLGISFHGSKNGKRATTTNADSSSTAVLAAYDTLSTSLVMLDYIKIYHDLRSWLHLRYALDLWTFRVSAEGMQPQKIRLLKNARLVLLDDTSQGILIS
ncbi:hypothetical protein BDZ97DRAFT_1762416 [Flammula alnicola]|nr:hypothetical protein BDZ97DRAFT_1762416 [Flammula alnicola]